MTKFYDVDGIRRGDPGNSHSVMLELVGPDRRVLDVGCATGYLAGGLVQQGCTVTGVDNDAQALEKARVVLDRGVLADLDHVDLVGEFGEGRFDVVVFGDVLEHLRAPGILVRAARRLLAPGGFIVVSIPNVSHGDVRLALFAGRWEYRPLGLLDDTHIRFFTRESFQRLLAECGFVALDVRPIIVPLFGTELGLNEGDFAPEVVLRVRSDDQHGHYQYVIKAVPDDAEGAVRELAVRHEALAREERELRRRLAELTARCDAAVAELEVAAAEADQLPGLRIALVQAQAQARELDALRRSRTFRWSAPLRRVWGGLRQAAG